MPTEDRTTVLSATPVVSTTPAYAANDCVGGLMTFALAAKSTGRGFVVHSVVITDKGKQNAALKLILFDSNPSGSTFTDNAAITIVDADLIKVIGVVDVTSYTSFADNSVGVAASAGLACKLASGTSLYGVLFTTGTPTYTATSDLTVRLGLLQD
jgi:hypothetical protein